jgi:hypothetical protein
MKLKRKTNTQVQIFVPLELWYFIAFKRLSFIVECNNILLKSVDRQRVKNKQGRLMMTYNFIDTQKQP